MGFRPSDGDRCIRETTPAVMARRLYATHPHGAFPTVLILKAEYC